MKNKKIGLRITEKEYKRIIKLSKKEGPTLSSYVRKMAVENESIAIDIFNPMISDLKENGKELNNIVMFAHQGSITEIDLSNIKAVLNNILETLKIQKNK